MAFKKSEDGSFKYSIRGINRIIEERGQQFLRLSQIAWNVADGEEVDPSKIKLDLRKFRTDSEGNEIMSKGVSFMTEEGPHELVHVMIEEGFGDTEKCIRLLKERKDFKSAANAAYGKHDDESEDETFDLRDLL